MHFIGGLLVGLISIQIFLFFYRRTRQEIKGQEIILASILGALSVGIAWEFLEFTADKFYVARVELKTLGMFYDGWRGSLRDLLFDLSGALTAAILFLSSFLWKKEKQQ